MCGMEGAAGANGGLLAAATTGVQSRMTAKPAGAGQHGMQAVNG